ncbi:MAG: glycerol-3-phosphate 1-O-acyltransferase PlsY [Defluviitaleaceae bacterium]|nr:glycerol-3-phosphate 1-O-acyltransferase PlsY [Defluviitaleaceae bacterium]
MLHLLFMLIGYLIGCFQSAYIVGKIAGKIDIRDHGSGNAGTTNMVRVLGKKAGAVVLLLDVTKAVLAVMLANYVFYGRIAGLEGMELFPGLLTGLGVILGHNFPFFLKFKGGKGVASSLGVVAMFDWRILLIVVVIGLIVLITIKFMSLASLVAFTTLAAATAAMYHQQIAIIAVVWVMAALGFFTHRSNIGRLLRCEENKFSLRKRKSGKS